MPLGIGIERDFNAGVINHSQEASANTTLDWYGIADAHSAEVEPVSIVEEPTASRGYKLLQVSRFTRPDITHPDLTVRRERTAC